MKTPVLQLIFFVFCFQLGGLLHGQQQLELQVLDNPFTLSGFKDAESVVQVSLDYTTLANHQEDAMLLWVPFGEEDLTFDLHRRELRSRNFQRSFASGRADNLVRPSAQFIGSLQHAPKSVAYFTFDDDFLLGNWEERGVRWVLEPLWLTDPTAPRDVYLLYREDNLVASERVCTVSAEAAPVGTGRSSGWIGSREIELAVAVDSLMYNQFPDAASVENFVLGLLNLVQGDYDRGFDNNLCFRLADLYLSDRPENEAWNPTQNSETLLADFQIWANTNDWAERYDMAALWTGRNISSNSGGFNNIGFAYIRSACGTQRYHIVENWTRNLSSLRAIWSHEIGHNLGATHASGSRLIMNPNVGAQNNQWGRVEREEIRNSVRNFFCLELSPWLLFTATGQGTTSTLDWSYTFREANEGFFVERAGSPNGEFTSLAWVPANERIGNSMYRYLEEGLAPGSVLYYRLRQVDEDGTEFISPVERVVLTYPEGVRISPNPASNFIRVVSDSDVSKEYRVTDVVGRVVRSGRVFLGGTDINLSGLDAGVYLYYEVDEKEVKFVTKFVKR